MAGPDYGALGATFKIVRILQIVSLLACIGMAANFISQMIQNNDAPSKELVGTLSVVSLTEFRFGASLIDGSSRPASPFFTASLL